MSTLKHAIALARNGHSNDACVILRQLVVNNKNDIYAWLWLAEYSPNADEARDAAYQVLALRPTNQRARKVLERMGEVAVPRRQLSQVRSQDGKLKRRLVIPFSGDERQAGLLVMGFLLVLATVLFLVLGIMASGRNDDPHQSENETPLESFLAPLQQSDTENVESDDSQTQQVVEIVGGAALEHGVKIVSYTIKVDLLFNLLRVVDGSANFNAEDRLSITVAEQTVESPRYSDIVGSVYDGGEWLYEKVRDVVTSPFR